MKCFAAAALALLLAAPVLAQNAPVTAGTAPGANQAAGMNEANANRFMTNEKQGQWLVGNLWNRSVYNASGQSIGELKDVVIGPGGRVQALVIGVGGFLGLGEKNVAVDYNYLENNGAIAPDRITLNMTEQELRSAPSFKKTGSAY